MNITWKTELDPVSFIAGDYQEFEYDIVDVETGKPVDLRAATELKMALFRWGHNDTPAVVVNGFRVAVDGVESAFKVILDSKITAELSGFYIQQPILVDSTGKIFRPGQGTVNVIPRAYEENAVINATNQEARASSVYYS